MEILETRKTDNYVLIKFNTRTSDFNKTMHDIERWCQLTTCGKRVNIHSVAFKKDEEIVMFKLRWMTQVTDISGKF